MQGLVQGVENFHLDALKVAEGVPLGPAVPGTSSAFPSSYQRNMVCPGPGGPDSGPLGPDSGGVPGPGPRSTIYKLELWSLGGGAPRRSRGVRQPPSRQSGWREPPMIRQGVWEAAAKRTGEPMKATVVFVSKFGLGCSIALLGRKLAFRERFLFDSARQGLNIVPPQGQRHCGGPILKHCRTESSQNPARESHFQARKHY